MSVECLLEQKRRWEPKWYRSRKEEEHHEQKQIRMAIVQKRERRKRRLQRCIRDIEEELVVNGLTYGLRELESLWNQMDPLLTNEGILAFPTRVELNQTCRALSVTKSEKYKERIEGWMKMLEWEGSAMERWEKLAPQ
jgi:hypothetical protein